MRSIIKREFKNYFSCKELYVENCGKTTKKHTEFTNPQ